MSESRPHYLWLAPGTTPPDVSSWAPFKAIIVLNADYSSEWQNKVSNWLVTSGCRYMMAWGPNSATWDDSVDVAHLEARNFEEDDGRFVMTTWHDDETLESTFWYSQFCAGWSYDDVPLVNAIIVDISREAREAELLALFAQSRSLADREPD